MCGVKTNVVTAVEITDATRATAPSSCRSLTRPLENFTMRQVSADEAYSSGANLKAVVDNHATALHPVQR